MDLPERIAAFFTKVGLLIGVSTAGFSWLDNMPAGVWIGLTTGGASLAVQVFFRFLADRRDQKQKRLEENLRQIEHEIYRQRYSQPPTQPSSLEQTYEL